MRVQGTTKKNLTSALRKLSCITTIILVAYMYVLGLDWWITTQNFTARIISALAFAFVVAMPHELLHALAWWYFGHFAVPVPILIPPILGVTIGEKIDSKRERVIISLAPILLTGTSYIAYQTTGNDKYFWFGTLNLFGMAYDILSALFK